MLKFGKIYLITCLLLMSLAGKGQDVTARLELDRRMPTPQEIEYVSVDGGIIIFGNMSKKSSRYMGITKFDNEFNQEWQKEVLKQNGRINLDLVTVLGERILSFFSEYDPRLKVIRTTYTELDLQGNVVTQDEQLAELANEKEYRVDLKYTRSINKRKLLCYKNLDNSLGSEKLLYYMFDADSDEVIKGEINIPYPDDKFQVRKIAVSNSGNIYLLGKFYRENKVKNPDDYGFLIYKFAAGEPEGKEVKVESGNIYVNDLTMKVDRDDNVYLAGFYSHKSADAIIGTSYFRYNDKLEEQLSSTQHFDESFLQNFMRDKQIEKGKELSNFYLDNIIMRSDGGLLMIAEKYYVSYNSYLDVYGYWVDQRIYHYDDIIISSVSGNGELEWSAVAPKRQSSEIRENLSYIDIVNGQNLFLIYGYNPRREPRTLYMNVVDWDGGVSERQLLFQKYDGDNTFYPRKSLQVSNTEGLIVYFNNNDKIWVILKVRF